MEYFPFHVLENYLECFLLIEEAEGDRERERPSEKYVPQIQNINVI